MLDKEKNKGELRPYLRNVNVRWHGFDLSDLKEMRFQGHEQERYGLKVGDVVVCEGGEPGRAAVWLHSDVDMRMQKALHRVRCGPVLRPQWLVYMLRRLADTGLLAHLFTGIGIKHLTGVSLGKVPVPLPSLEEQDRILEVVEKSLVTIDALKASMI
jgi:type I restriction enzyme S subunit